MDGSSWVPGKVELGVELKGGEGMSFPHPSDNMETPLFFGIDIRSESELQLGRLPKVKVVMFFDAQTDDLTHLILYIL